MSVFHRTLKVELLNHNRYADLIEVGKAFEQWRFIYNTQRPHEALNLATPISRYINSTRLYPENLPPIEYDYDDVVRKVNVDGKLSIKGKVWIIGRSLEGQLVALRKTQQEDIIDVFYCHQKIKTIDLRG